MSDDYVKMMRERVETLERRMNRFELVHEQHVAQAIESRNQRDERIEKLEAWNREGGVLYNLGTKLSNLEDQHEEDRTTIYGQLGEVEETLSQDRLYAVNREREEHKARWHATYNAAVPALIALEMPMDMVRAEAAKFADRAHGPLEAKTTLCTHENYSCVKERQEVDALVKAARVALPMMAGLDAHYGSRESGEAIDALADAVKVFEQSCPLVGCERAMPHVHEVSGPFEAKP